VARGADLLRDSIGGKNSNAAPRRRRLQDFSNINGRTLAAGERLLIKRGSVLNQELRVNAQGTREQWVEIGAYGEGARPVIPPQLGHRRPLRVDSATRTSCASAA